MTPAVLEPIPSEWWGADAERFRVVSDPFTDVAYRGANQADRALDEVVVELFADYEPHAKQREFHRAREHRFVAVNAGRRSGKTHSAGREFLDRVFDDLEAFLATGSTWLAPDFIDDATKPALLYWAIAPTYDLTQYQKQEIFDALGGLQSPLILKWNSSSGRLWLVGGIKIEFKTGDRPERLVAAGCNGIWIDEAARIKEILWRDNVRPTLADRQGWALFTSTPMGVANWFYREVWQKTQHGYETDQRDEQYFGVTYHTVDNTAIPGLAEEVEAAERELPAEVFRRNFKADFFAFEGKIYSAFEGRRGPHVVDAVPFGTFVKRIAGVDWGFANPGAYLEIGIDRAGRWWVYHEEYHADLLVRPAKGKRKRGTWQHIFELGKKRGVERFWGDPSEPETIAGLRAAELNFLPADNAVHAGIDVVHAMLKLHPNEATGGRSPNLFIHSSCDNLIEQLASYQWHPSGNGKPLKTEDHACDALRYAVYSQLTRGGGIRVLDEVSSIWKR